VTVVEFVEVHRVAFGVAGVVGAISYMFRQVLREAGNYLWSLFWELAFPFRSFDKTALGGFTRWMVRSGARCARSDNPGEIQWVADRWVVSEGRRRFVLSQTREPQPGYYLFRGAVLKVGDNYLRWVRGTFDADRALRDYEAWQVAFEEKRKKPGSAIPSADRVPGFEVRRYTGSGSKGDYGFGAARQMRKAVESVTHSNNVEPPPPPSSGGTGPDWDIVPIFLDREDVKNFDPTVNPFEDYVESPESRQVRRYFRFWLEQEHWHREHRVPWRLGVLLYGLPGTGKCLAKGTPVLMFDGTTKPVELVVEGDLLMGPDSSPRCVLGTCTGREAMYRVTPVKGDSYEVNESHILSLKHNGRVVNVSVRDYLKKRRSFRDRAKGWRTGVDFQEVRVPIDPYLLGVWLGDGTASKPDITTADPEIVSMLACRAKNMGLVTRVQPNTNSGAAEVVTMTTGDHGGRGEPRDTRNYFLANLRDLGVFRNKHIPHLYKANSRQVRLQVLAGLIDTDGSVSCGGYDIVQKSRTLANDIAFMARSLGLAAYVAECQKTCTNSPTKATNTYYRVSISGDCSMVPVRIPRKAVGPRRQNKDVLCTGISVESVGIGEYYGFELSGDGLFLLGDFTVTHNTSLVRCLAQEANCRVAVLDLSAMEAQEFDGVMQNIRSWLGAGILLIEDVDCTFSGRENIRGEGGVTLDQLLNFLDGVDGLEGIATFITTNHVEKLDPALIRDGRVDVKVELPVPDQAGKRRIASRIVDDPEVVEELVREGADLGAAAFTGLCTRRARDMRWSVLSEGGN